MLSFFKKFWPAAITIGVLSAIILPMFYSALKPEERLPVFQPAMVNFELVDSSMQHIKKYHTIADFQLVNQNGKIITQKEYENKIYIADFFFTTCPTICPVMTKNMVAIQEVIKRS